MTKNKNNTPLNPFANKLSGDVIAIGSGVGLFGGTQVQRAPSPSAHATVDINGGEPGRFMASLGLCWCWCWRV